MIKNSASPSGSWQYQSILYLSLVIAASACSRSAEDPSSSTVRELPASTVLLRYQGGEIKASDIHQQVAPELQKLRDETTHLYRAEAEKAALSRLLEVRAITQGFKNAESYEESLKTKIEVSESEVLGFIKRNHLPTDSNREKVKAFLLAQSWNDQKVQMNAALMKDAAFEWKITGAKHEFETKGLPPPKGTLSAQVAIHEFCDFANSLCAPLRLGIEQLLSRYPKEIVFYFHPLPSHDRSGSYLASYAAFCAAEEGKFWEMSNRLFDNQSKLNDESIQNLSKTLNLDQKNFHSCLSDPRTRAQGEVAVAYARTRGIEETPALFVNGERVDSVDQLKARVDAIVLELAK